MPNGRLHWFVHNNKQMSKRTLVESNHGSSDGNRFTSIPTRQHTSYRRYFFRFQGWDNGCRLYFKYILICSLNNVKSWYIVFTRAEFTVDGWVVLRLHRWSNKLKAYSMPSRHNLLWLKCGPLLAINKCNQRGRYNRTKSNQSNPFKLRASSSPPHAHAHPLARWVTLAPAAAKPPRVFVRAPTMRAADSRADCTVLSFCRSLFPRTSDVFDIHDCQPMFLTLVVVERCF